MPLTFELLTSQIENGQLVHLGCDRAEWDAARNSRETNREFDQAWLTARKHVTFAAENAPPDSRSLAADLARRAFLIVSQLTGQHEIASFVSDDIELLALASLASVHDTFIERLDAGYILNGFAKPPLPEPAV